MIRSTSFAVRRTLCRLAACGVLAAGELFAHSGLAASSCTLHQLADLPASFNGGVFIEVSINGAPAKFALATGWTISQISRSFAQRLNLPTNTAYARVNSEHGTTRPV